MRLIGPVPHWLLTLSIVLLGCFCSPAAMALTMAPMTLNETVRAADAIVTGTVIGRQSRWGDASKRWMQTDYTLAVEDVVYPSEQGAPIGRTIVLTYWGGTIDGETHEVPDVRLPVEGERLVALLQTAWVKGGAVAPTVGFNLGLFTAASGTLVMHDAEGRALSLTGAGPTAQANPTAAADAATMDLAAFSGWLRANVGSIKAAPAASKDTADPNDPRLMKLFSKSPATAGAAEFSQSLMRANAVAPAQSPAAQAGVPAAQANASPATAGGGTVAARTDAPITPAWASTRHPNAPILVNNFTSGMSPWSPEDQYLLSNWNHYAAGVFTVPANPTGSFGWQDGSFDLAGFVDDATSQSVYGAGWSCGSGCVTLGITYIRYNGDNVVIEADILLNPASSWTLDDEWVFNGGNVKGFRQTMFHEMGHMLGLDHSFGSMATMNYFEPGKYRAVGLPYMDDAVGIRGLFPSKATARTDLGVYLYYLSATCSPVTFNNCVSDATYPSTVIAGSDFAVNNYHVENAGTTTIATPTIEWYLTAARNFNSSYYSLGTTTYPSLGSGINFTASTVGRTLTVPANIPPGNYYLAAYIRNDTGPSQATFPFSNNYAFSRTPISIVARDTTPDPFSFTSYLAAPLNSVMTSNSITVSGINVPTTISVSGGSYSVNDGGYTTGSGSINYADTVRVRATASGSYSTQTCATLTIGGVSGQFCGTTISAPVDTTPNPFSFVSQTEVALNTAVTSNTITVSGINAAAPISITGSGTYSVNGGGYTSSAGSVNNGNTVNVRLTASGNYGTQTCTTLTIGGVSGQFCLTTPWLEDTTPNPFSFTAQTGLALNTIATSNTITVSGIDSAAPISVTGGSYSVNGGGYTTAPGSAYNGNTVNVRLTSSGSYSTQTCVTLTIGGVSGQFCGTTQASPGDTTPDSFTFYAQGGVALNSVVTSTAITVSGINTAAPISVTGGSYSVNGGAYTAAPGSVYNSNTVSLSVTASGSYSTQTCAMLTIGGVSAPFCATTLAQPVDTTPNAFSFTAQIGVARNAVVTSDTITVSGINAAASISVTGGSFSVNGGTYTAALGSVNNGNTVSLRQTSSGSPNTQKCATLTIGGVSGQFCATTQSNSSGLTPILMLLLN